MAKFKEKYKAIQLREKGESIKDISEALRVSKSVVSRWCRNIKLTNKQIERLHEKMMEGSYKGRMKFLENVRKARKEETIKLKEEGLKEIGKLSNRDLLIGGIAMYCSEGTTSVNAEETSFSNSDPKMVLYMLKWFKEVCEVSMDRFALQIRINKIHKNRIREIEGYWSRLTKIPSSQFTKTVLINTKSKKIYSNYNNHYGTVRVSVHKGVKIRRKIIGWIEGLLRVV
ncbi:helix-turn-helix domain-containing protein [Patescibacteria group bacterium]|nr:helix-turn-helix domain-containing protein [Patescibacteria group bacterium]